jgi:hypothetical protein
MCILVSARLQATAAPDAPAPMISTSTGSVILVLPLGGAACELVHNLDCLDDVTEIIHLFD